MEPTAETATELKPCPFCGGKAEIEQEGTRRAPMIIVCEDCGCRVEGLDVVGLTKTEFYKWNTRTSDAAAEARAEARGWEAGLREAAEKAGFLEKVWNDKAQEAIRSDWHKQAASYEHRALVAQAIRVQCEEAASRTGEGEADSADSGEEETQSGGNG